MGLVSKITGLIKSETKLNSEIVVFQPTPTKGSVAYGEFYTVSICPKCKHVLDATKARYASKCCYLCGHTTGDFLFDPILVVVRDRFVDGLFFETLVHERR